MPQSVVPAIPQSVAPNHYELSGNQLHITYSTTSFIGRPNLTYQDAHQSKTFVGDEIRVVESDLGKLVSVTLRMTVDTGSTSLSLFIPRMQIIQGTSVAVNTYCVTTLHRFSVIPQFNLGQLDTYNIVALHGTGQFEVY